MPAHNFEISLLANLKTEDGIIKGNVGDVEGGVVLYLVA